MSESGYKISTREAGFADIANYFDSMLESWCIEKWCAYCKHYETDIGNIVVETTTHDTGESFDDQRSKGTCTRYPPHPKYGQPVVEDMDTCGEWAEGRKDAVQLWAKTYRELSTP